ncbi:hypothetical protein P691DRAFT_767102 [Macrolepiota fuliginosa MF-IS2]|uniref:Uncharacterized protein n=1 Tax=Macrolepiota fuliginosa MF-IS2 TaxID=1400762 RepID=A0A9P6BWU0_9AGAR|nr:hypothetical protein P691DRAFT_767102 [Macrolepiota fuliginosa MF-IS2]
MDPSETSNENGKGKKPETRKLFKCDVCGEESEMTTNQRANHRRTCTNQSAGCWYPAPGTTDDFTLYVIHNRIGTVFKCIRCNCEYRQDNALQKHTKLCIFKGLVLDDPVTIFCSRNNKNTNKNSTAHNEEPRPANSGSNLKPASPYLLVLPATQGVGSK